MSFSDEIAKASNERYTLIEMGAKRNLTDLITQTSPNYYSVPFTDSIELVGYASSSVAVGQPGLSDETLPITGFSYDTSLSSNNTWYNDDTTLYIRSTVTFSNDSSRLLVSFKLRITDGPDLAAAPAGGADVMWVNRLKKSPTVTKSIGNALSASLTSSSSSLSLENSDGKLNTSFLPQDWYIDGDVDVWFMVNGQFNKALSGKIRTLDFTGTTVAIGVVDRVIDMTAPALFGSTIDESTYTAAKGASKDNDLKPVPMFVGETTYNTLGYNNARIVKQITNTVTGDGFTFSIGGLDPEVCEKSVPYGWNGNTSGGILPAGQLQILGRSAGEQIANVNQGSISSITVQPNNVVYPAADGQNSTFAVVTSSGHNVRIGHSGAIYINNATVAATVGWFGFSVYDTTTTGFSIIIDKVNKFNSSFINLPTNAIHSTMKDLCIFAVNKTTNLGWIPVLSPVSSVSEVSVSSYPISNGTYLHSIYFANSDRVANSLSSPKTSESKTDVYFTVRYTKLYNHEQLMRKALAPYFVPDNTSFVAAAADEVSTKCVARYPDKTSGQHKKVLDVVQGIMKSAGTFLSSTSANNILKYQKFESLNGTPAKLRTDDDVLSSTARPSMSYYDIRTAHTYYNKVMAAIGDSTLKGDKVLEFTEASSLGSLNNRERIESVLESPEVIFSGRLNSLYGKPRVSYRYRTASLDLDTEVGDYVRLQTSGLLGNVPYVDILVTKVIKSTKEVAVTGLEIT